VQCATDGRCRCKSGVVGDKCNQCAPYHYNFGPNGCAYVNLSLAFVLLFCFLSYLYSQCACYEPGSLQPLQCNSKTGQCTCKTFVEGQNCDK
jgi:laminin gamma 1